MAEISFRTARADELPAIVALLSDDVLGKAREAAGALPPGYRAAFDAIAADPNQMPVVAVEGEAVIGTMQLSFLPGISRQGAWRGQIEAVRIAADRRSGGLGQRMIEWAIERCRARGCQHVQLTTDKRRTDAHRFYDKLGFESSHFGYKLKL